MKDCLSYLLIGFIILASPGSFSSPVWGEDSKNLKKEMSQERQRLEKLNKEIAETKKKASRVKKKHGSVLKTIEKLDRRLLKQKKAKTRIKKDLVAKDKEIEALRVKIEKLDEDVNRQQGAVSARLRLLYTEGRTGYLKALFSAQTFSEAAHRLEYVSWLAQQEHRIVRQFQKDLTTLHTLHQQKNQARDDLLRLQDETKKTIQEISGIQKNKRTVLVSLSKEKDTHERMVQDLKRSAEKVDGILKALDKRFQLARSQRRNVPARLPSLGSFLWPVKGKVVSFFGRQKHPTFDTYVNKKGIEIRAREGSPIRSVSAGTIVYADWLKGYGLVVILDHTNGFYSLYAHASKVLVKEGQTVKKGHIIGETGETGVTDENTLYFELRKGTKPVDPLKWLVKGP